MTWMLYIPLFALGCVLFFRFLPSLLRVSSDHYAITPGTHSAVRREVLLTLLNLPIFAAAGAAVDLLLHNGKAAIYSGGPDSTAEIWWLILSPFIALLANDIYFYFSHRLLHLPVLFRHIHHWHHDSHHANAWTAFSFHPIEGIVQIGIVPLLAWLLPIPNAVFMGYAGFMLFMSVYGHSGYELRPDKAKLFQMFNTSVHHDQHHRYVHYNFGLYLKLWDTIFHTLHPEYDNELRSVSTRIRGNRKSQTTDQGRAG